MIDWARVVNLHDEIGPEGFSAVVDLFLEETGSIITLLRDAPDPDIIEQGLHALRGGALNLGFTQVSRLCEQGEVLAAAGQPDQIDVTAIVQAFDRALQVFLSELTARLAR